MRKLALVRFLATAPVSEIVQKQEISFDLLIENCFRSEKQADMKVQYEANNFKTLISNNYDEVITEIIEFMRDTRVKCQHCSSRFKSSKTLKNHCKYFHRII